MLSFVWITDGRLEDGYLAWSSIYLHELFGFTIYTPLTADEHKRMKDGGKIPKWMNEFSSLPNLAIPLSYFCIGVALQLLRTPLIVYFIEDLKASAAEVNVLFTVSTCGILRQLGFFCWFMSTDLTSLTSFFLVVHSGGPLVFQSHLRLSLRLSSHFGITSQTLLYDGMVGLHCFQSHSHDLSHSFHSTLYLIGLYANGRIHVG
jgi:hypothetical protein